MDLNFPCAVEDNGEDCLSIWSPEIDDVLEGFLLFNVAEEVLGIVRESRVYLNRQQIIELRDALTKHLEVS